MNAVNMSNFQTNDHVTHHVDRPTVGGESWYCIQPQRSCLTGCKCVSSTTTFLATLRTGGWVVF